MTRAKIQIHVKSAYIRSKIHNIGQSIMKKWMILGNGYFKLTLLTTIYLNYYI